jgi:hypothetical protein
VHARLLCLRRGDQALLASEDDSDGGELFGHDFLR